MLIVTKTTRASPMPTSPASRACSFDISPAKLHVQVSSSGRVIWDASVASPARTVKLSR